jgi:hypothetical protein
MFHLALASQNALHGGRREEGEFDESDGKGKWDQSDKGARGLI